MTDERPSVSLVAAIVVGLLASLAQSFGLTLTRKSHVQDENKPIDERSKEWKRPLWIIGSLIFILSNSLGSVFQLSALPIVILAPLGGVSLCWNALFAKFILGDSFSRYLFVGTILIAGGAVLIAVFGTVEEPTHTLDELIALYNRPAFIAWFTVLCCAVLGILVTANLLEWTIKKNKAQRLALYANVGHQNPDHNQIPHSNASDSIRLRRRWSEPLETIKSDAPQDDGNASSKSVDALSPSSIEEQIVSKADAEQAERKATVIGIAYGGASGTLSGLCLLFAKTGTELLLMTFFGENQFGRWQSWMIVLVLAVAGVLQLWYLNRALKMLGPTLVCPLAFCFYNLSSILNGLMYYDQWVLLSPLQVTFMSLGIVVLFVGVWIVSLKTTDEALAEEADISERTPLMQEPAEMDTYSDSDEDDELVGREARGLAAMKRFLTEARPRGFSIGIGASSPGFAIRPQDSSRVRRDRKYSTGLPSSASLPSLERPQRAATLDSPSDEANDQLLPARTSPTTLMRRSLRRSLTGSLYVGVNTTGGAHSRQNSLDHVLASPASMEAPVSEQQVNGKLLQRSVSDL